MSLAFSRDLLSGVPGSTERLPTLGWNNLFLLGDVAASSVDGEHAPELAFDGYTSTAWRTAAGSGSEHWLQVSTEGQMLADYAAIAAHTLGDTVVTPEYFSGSAWQAAGPVLALPSGAPAVWLFDAPISASAWRLLIQGAPAEIEIGAAHIGLAMRPDTGLAARWSPPSLNERAEYSSPISVGGQLLPRQVRRRGVEVPIDLPQLGYDFARGDWQSFLAHAEERAFFFWLLFGNHAEVVYGGLDDNSNYGRITRARRTDLGLRMIGIDR